MSLATTANLDELRAREPVPEVTALIERRLAQVELKTFRRVPDLATHIEYGHMNVADIEPEAVLRVTRNLGGSKQRTTALTAISDFTGGG